MFAFKKINNQEKQLALSDIKPWAYLVDDGIILNKNGAIIAGFAYRGEDLANITQDTNNHITLTINQALKMFDNGYILNADLIRTKHNINFDNANYFNNLVSHAIEQERINQFKNNDYYTSEYIITITYLPDVSSKNRFTEKFFDEDNQEYTSSLDYILDNFKNKISEFENLMSSVLKIRRLRTTEITQEYVQDELCNYLNYSLTCINQKLKLPIGYALDEWIGNQDFIGGIYPKIGDYYLSIISIDQFPHSTQANILQVIDKMPFDLRHHTRFIYSNKEQAEKLIRKQQKLWDSQTTKFSDMIFEKIFSTKIGRFNRDASNMSEDSEIALTDARSEAVKFGYYTSTIILFDEDINNLQEKSKIVTREVQRLGFNARIEKINAMDTFFGTLSGMNKSCGFREPIVHTLNLSNLIHTTSLYLGEEYSPNPFLQANSPALSLAVTQGSTPFHVNLHVQDVGHTCIIGQIGSGKSTLLAFIMAQYQRYENAKIFAFDQRLSLFTITKACNGNHYEIGENQGLKFCPLALVTDNASIAWAIEYLTSLIEMQNIKVNAQHKKTLYEALQSILDQQDKSLSQLISYIQDIELKTALVSYTKQGALGSILDGSQDNLFINDITTFELQQLLNMGEKNIIAVITYLFYWIERKLDNNPTLIVLDECWLILMRSWFKDKFIEWLKTLRKMNCAVVFATQSLSDFTDNTKLFSNILEACSTKIFLPNPNADQKGSEKLIGLNELYKSFGLNDAQINIIKHAQHKKEYFIHTKLGSRLIDFQLGHIAKTFCCAGIEQVPHIKQLIQEYPNNWQEIYINQKINNA
ncbi:MAG: hypothetical protein RLZZ210_613 [Pseudomonadota bacterium]|jgi:type IV secretion system protein VirB4